MAMRPADGRIRMVREMSERHEVPQHELWAIDLAMRSSSRVPVWGRRIHLHRKKADSDLTNPLNLISWVLCLMLHSLTKPRLRAFVLDVSAAIPSLKVLGMQVSLPQ